MEELLKWEKNQNKILESWIIRNYGKRHEYMKGCVACEAWKMFDELKYSGKEFE